NSPYWPVTIRLNMEEHREGLSTRSPGQGRTPFTAPATNSFATTHWMPETSSIKQSHPYDATSSGLPPGGQLSRTRLFSSPITRASDGRRVSQVLSMCHLRLLVRAFSARTPQAHLPAVLAQLILSS